jgi:formylglycine-generating enzyme required for sulfatase activity
MIEKDIPARGRSVLWWLLLWAGVGDALAGPPAIIRLSLGGGGPRLSISSDLGVTNQIQSATNLSSTAWVALTNVYVTQSPYDFVDTVTAPATERFYRVLVPNAQTNPPPPSGMVLIPAGSFQMGDTFNEGEYYELPVHTVYVSAFYMDEFEVTKALWDQVKSWSDTNGYSYDYPGSGKAPDHPVQSIDWYDMVKWCNARSELEGRLPSYYTDAALTQVYRTGLVAPFVNWSAGYRLPTEAEWEKAARGGAAGHRFPWTNVDTITHSQANYYSDPSYSYDISPTRGFDPAFNDGVLPYTSPVGSFAPNGYGLYDMAGNVWEWCWDWAGPYPADPQTDPHGPDTGTTRVGRGGNWDYYAAHCRNAYRYGNSPDDSATNIGFRCAMSAH